MCCRYSSSALLESSSVLLHDGAKNESAVADSRSILLMPGVARQSFNRNLESVLLRKIRNTEALKYGEGTISIYSCGRKGVFGGYASLHRRTASTAEYACAFEDGQ